MWEHTSPVLRGERSRKAPYLPDHYHSGLNFVTPSSRHCGQAKEIMANRKKVYMAAKLLHPLRFKRGIKNFDLPECVSLNPQKDEEMVKIV